MIFMQILIALLLLVAVVWATTVYWQRVEYKKNQEIQKQKDAYLERLKDIVSCKKQIKHLSSRVDFLKDVQLEVLRQNEEIDNDIQKLITSHLQPGQTAWDETCSRMKEHSDQLSEMLHVTIELLRYEEMTEIEQADTLQMNAFCREMFESCCQHADGALELRLETELEDDETVCTNRMCLQIVLTNLLVCAMQFTHEGEIVLEVIRYRHKQKSYLMFAVKDSGLDIPENVKDIVFDKLTGKNIRDNIIGVRLRLCKAIVRLLGGTIHAEPTIKGTSITFTVHAS